MSYLKHTEFENLLVAKWTNFIDATKLIQRVLADAHEADFKSVVQDKSSFIHRTSVTITRFAVANNNVFEIWAEFLVPIDNKLAVGTHTYHLSLDGNLTLVCSNGVLFDKKHPENNSGKIGD